ncbi:MAG: M43 family zinc metalloprotease [Polyangiales bacterium]
MLVVCAALVVLALLRARAPRTEPAAPRGLPDAQPAPVGVTRRSPSARAPTQTPAPSDHDDCLPAALEQCVTGDVWSLDSCGHLEEKVDECGARACRDDACDPPPEAPCDESPDGRCDGDTVRLCELGKLRVIDCRKQGMRCGRGDEGAECKPQVPPAERCHGADRCDGDVLVQCDDGARVRTDCRALRAKCLKLTDAVAPRCVEVRPLPPPDAACGACGCPPIAEGAETCDGRDQDADGRIDEELDCGPVPVIAFVVTDASGRRSHADEDVTSEITAANALFARTEVEGAPRFRLDEIVPLALPALLDLDEHEIDRLADDPRIHPPRDAFYVPLLFVDGIVTGQTPKAGVSTLPNGTCGGLQESQGPEVGLVAVAKARYPTTVAHELGHFLGLCHTHDAMETSAVVAVGDPARGSITRCRPLCTLEGDGVCDTPSDPGPDVCASDSGCRAACRANAAPDPSNLMSYYSRCRDRFSTEQLQRVQHTLALRRGWHRCAFGACACTLGDASCPTGMTCRPVILQTGEEATRCGLDGPRPPGADCSRNDACGGGAICLSERATGMTRCVRACRTSQPGCACTEAGETLRICIEDLHGAAR